MEQTIWNILLVEDDEEDYLLTRDMLLDAQRGKYRLHWVDSYAGGLSALKDQRFDAALIDFQLGARSGVELIREAVAAGANLPLVLLTGHGSYDIDLQSMQAGADDYLTKADLNPVMLERALRFAIERKRITAELAQANSDLQQERARLEAVLKNAPSGIVLTDREGNFLLTNPASRELFFGGITGSAAGPDSTYTLHFLDGRRMQPDDMPMVQALTGGRTRHNVEMVIRAEDGQERTILANTAPVTGPNGEIEGTVAVLQDISLRKRVEMERERLLAENVQYQNSLEQQRSLLEQQNNLLEQIVEYAQAGIALIQGDDYRFTLVNPAYQVMARGKGEVLGRTIKEVWPEVYDQIMALFHEVEETGEPITRVDLPLTLVRDHGPEETFFTFTYSPVFDDFGAVEGIMALVLETTEQVNFHRRLEAERAWLESVVHELPVAVWIADPSGRVLLANRAANFLFGETDSLPGTIGDYPTAAARSVESGHALEPGDWALARAVAGARVAPEEVQIVRADGQPATILTSGAPIFNPDGALLGAVAVAQDITRPKKLEEEVRRTAQRNRQMLSMTFEGVWTLDDEGTTLAINDRGAAILGYTVAEMINRPMFDFFYLEDLDQRLLWQLSDTAAETSSYREWRVQHKDGSEVWISTSSTQLMEEDGGAGVLIMFTDITDRKRGERQSHFLNELGRTLLLMDDPDTIAATTIQEVARFFDADRGRFEEVRYSSDGALILPPTELFEYRKHAGLASIDKSAVPPFLRLSAELAAGRELAINDVRLHPATSAETSLLEAFGMRSLVAIPHMPGARWSGTLWLACGSPRRWSAGEVNFLHAIADLAWQGITRARYFQQLRTLGERFRVALSQIPVSVFTLDQNLHPVWTYQAYQGGAQTLHLLAAPAVQALLQEVLSSGQAVQREIQPEANQPTYYLLTVEPLRDDEGHLTGLTGAAVDVSGQRRLEARQEEFTLLMEVQRRLLEQREMERQQIARDLHDGPIQDTMGLIFALQAATDLTHDTNMLTTLTGIREEATRLVSELRGVCNELRPPVLARFGLERALQAHAREFEERNPNLRLKLNLTEDGQSLNEDVRLALYRIYQASLNNVLRHAQASMVEVEFALEDDSILLRIRDDGIGFTLPDDWLELARAGHLGLVGMKERAEAVGGTLEVESRRGQGTQVRVRVPWKPDAAG